MDNKAINQLWVAHRLRDAAGNGMATAAEDQLRRQGFFLDTCLRQLVIIAATDNHNDLSAPLNDPAIEWRHGADAYSFLLQTATGLNSAVPGESNVLGQFRQGWHNWRAPTAAENVYPLHTIMQRLFADSRQIRHDYLQGIGGSSYGSLVRKLLNPAADSRVLFVGTGKLAQSMLPLFSAFATATWNHRAVDQPDVAGMESLAGKESHRLFAVADTAQAAGWATHIVLTTPAETHNDQLWMQLADPLLHDIVHLGRRRANPGIWSQWSALLHPEGQSKGRYADLDDIFELRGRQSSVRSLQLSRARKACEKLAARTGQTPHLKLPQSALA